MSRFQHPLEIHGFDSMVEDGLDVKDLEAKELLVLILTALQKIEFHLQIINDEEFEDSEVKSCI